MQKKGLVGTKARHENENKNLLLFVFMKYGQQIETSSSMRRLCSAVVWDAKLASASIIPKKQISLLKALSHLI